jgi:membrane protease YdiL (CAAX protease family)
MIMEGKSMETRKLVLKDMVPAAITSILAILKPAGMALIFAIPYLLIEKGIAKKSAYDLGFRMKNIPGDIKRYWWLILAPMLSGIVAVLFSKLILPEFYEHVLNRISPMLSFDKAPLLLVQLLILSFGEEIAFRAFLQTKLSGILNPAWGIIVTSALFAAGHFSAGSATVILYDLVFIFIDSTLYGVLYHETKNVFACAISHFLANLIGVFTLLVV